MRNLVGCSPLITKSLAQLSDQHLTLIQIIRRECLPEFSKNLLLRNPRFISLTNYGLGIFYKLLECYCVSQKLELEI